MHHTVCTLEELPPGDSRVVNAGGHEVVLLNLDGEILALDNRCAHKDQPLADGVIRDGILTCPAHLWRYDVRTGQRTDAPGWSVACHPVSVVDNEVVIEVPDPQPAKSIREQLLEHAREWNRDG